MSRTHSHADQLVPPHLIGLTRVTPEEFEEFCRDYPELRLELTSSGELIVMPPTGIDTGIHNAYLTAQLIVCVRKDRTGVGFDSNTAFTLPNGAIRSPDAAWMSCEKYNSLNDHDRRGFGRVCPDFVVELRSPTDSLPTLLNKMEEYIANGASLGWLIDPQGRRVYVYRAGEETIILEEPARVSGEPLLPGFELQMEEIW